LECIPTLIIVMMEANGGPRSLRSGSLAKAAGVSPDTIRHYERIGVLPKAARSHAGYRMYPESAVERVRVVQSALRVGFTLAELAEVLKARDTGGAPCRRVFEIAQEKLKQIEADIQSLKRTEKYLKAILSDWEGRLLRADGKRSNLLHSLPEAMNDSVRTTAKFLRRSKP
jgi:DNA-binding transcriptional MerR regulator